MFRRLRDLGAGSKVPNYVYVIIEVPMNSSVKYKYDEDLDLIVVDRVMYSHTTYPFNQGFIPGTRGERGEPLEAIVISDRPFIPGSLVEARPLGVLEIEVEEEPGHIIVSVPHDRIDPTYSHVKEVSELPEEMLRKIEYFFDHYEELEPGRRVRVVGWRGSQEARELILEAVKRSMTEKRS